MGFALIVLNLDTSSLVARWSVGAVIGGVMYDLWLEYLESDSRSVVREVLNRMAFASPLAFVLFLERLDVSFAGWVWIVVGLILYHGGVLGIEHGKERRRRVVEVVSA